MHDGHKAIEQVYKPRLPSVRKHDGERIGGVCLVGFQENDRQFPPHTDPHEWNMLGKCVGVCVYTVTQ